ncbi:MAG: PrsW family intramembrane metalloprotease [Myxococcales bacterium]|nr:PrsW family intramembrane metalloprotease [Myxococcales bacterium]
MDLQTAMAGTLPALAAMWYVDKADSRRPEPRATLRKVAVAGGLSTIPCIAAQLVLTKLFPLQGVEGALFTSFVMAGAVEELAKAACLFLFVWHRPEFDERFDGIVYATRAGLGFALVENVGYLLGTESMAGFAGVFIARAVLAVPGHAIYAGMMGYFAARRRFDGKGPGLFGGLVLAIALHGTYDAALFLLPLVPKELAVLALPMLCVPLLIVVVGFFALRGMARRAIAADDAAGVGHQGVIQALPVMAGFTLR